MALFTLGEGWHNNHHYDPGCARAGFERWEVDITGWSLEILAATGLVRDLRPRRRRVAA